MKETWSSGEKIEVGKIYKGAEVVEIRDGFDKYSPKQIVYRAEGGSRLMYGSDYFFIRNFIKSKYESRIK